MAFAALENPWAGFPVVGPFIDNLQAGIASSGVIWFNVKDVAFGAVGDGVADDTAACTAAVNAALAAPNGGVVYFPPGTYKITSTLPTISKKNVSLLGDGPLASIINYTGSGDAILVTEAVYNYANRAGGSIRRLKIVGTSASTGAGIHVHDYNDIFLNDLWVSNFSNANGSGIWFENQTRWTENATLLKVSIDICGKLIRYSTNTRTVIDGAWATGTSIITSATANFTVADIGKTIDFRLSNGNPNSSVPVVPQILSINSTTSVNVDKSNTGGSLVGQVASIGGDDSFGYHRLLDVRLNVGNGKYGISCEGNAQVHGSLVNLSGAANETGAGCEVIHLQDRAGFSGALVSQIEMENQGGSPLGLVMHGDRTLTDLVTNGTTTITSATASFSSALDLGKSVYNTTAWPGQAALISSVTNSTTAIVSVAASNSASGQTAVIGANRNAFACDGVMHWLNDALTNQLNGGFITIPDGRFSLASAGGAVTFDASQGTNQSVTLTGSMTSSLIINPFDGGLLTLSFIQDGTGGRTIVPPSNISWAKGPPTWSLLPNARNTIVVYWDGVVWQEIPLRLGSIWSSAATAAVGGGFAADTYISGSSINVGQAGGWKAGMIYRAVFDMAKTAAGVAAGTINVRMGTAGTTADASILTFTFGAGTAVADTGLFTIELEFRSVGSGTSAVVAGYASCNHQVAGGGLISTGPGAYGILPSASAGFNSTTSNILGVSYNGGAAFAGTNVMSSATLVAA